jgi:predicted lipoprotein with Yx(FWY)xxD motif
MSQIHLVLALAVVVGFVGVPAGAHELPRPLKQRSVPALGSVLTGPSGMTLYTYVNDVEPGKSACSGTCAEHWPPFRPDANAPVARDPLSVIIRDDGSKQYAWKGKPLYYWSRDRKVGDVGGHKFRDAWLVAQP